MAAQSFFATHPVFTVSSLEQHLAETGKATRHNRNRLLGYYRSRGRLLPVRTGLYAVVPPGANAGTYPVDSILVSALLRPDAVLGYHSAFAFHGVAHSLREEQVVITRRPLTRPFRFHGITYRTVEPPEQLVKAGQEGIGVERQERQNVPVSVCGLERGLVDCLDRPRLGGGWEEVWRSCEAIPYLDLDLVVRYALLLENATTAATVGYFLQLQEVRWMVTSEHLDRLRAHRPKQPHYLGRRRDEGGRLVNEWNLVVPERIFRRAWEETGEPIA
jgi:predicted transcriptional regulator of viral defense system